MHGCPPSFLSLGPTQQDTAPPKNVSAPARALLKTKARREKLERKKVLVAALLVSKLVQAKGCFTKILIVGSNASLRILHSLVSALERLLVS